MTNDKDLITRLRNGDAMNGRTVNCKLDQCNCAVMEDAASRLSFLQAENEALREALKPFAEAAESYDPEEEGDGPTAAWAHDFTIASLRRARSALSESKP